MNRIPSTAACIVSLLLWSAVARAQDSGPSGAQPSTSPGATAASSDSQSYSRLPNSPARFGLGLAVGNVLTGVTAKLWAASTVAFQAAVGESASGNNLWAHFDLLFSPGIWTSADGQYILPVYVGIGGVLGHDFASGAIASDTEGGFRLPLGMSVLVRDNPMELFFEIAPEFTVRGNANPRGKYGVVTDGAIGARYYF